MTWDEWLRCVRELRGAWPGQPSVSGDAWTRTWYRTLREHSYAAVAWAVVRVVKQPSQYPPSLGVFREHVLVVERQRGLVAPPPPEPDDTDLWRELNPGLDPPPPMSREAALERIRALGFPVEGEGAGSAE